MLGCAFSERKILHSSSIRDPNRDFQSVGGLFSLRKLCSFFQRIERDNSFTDIRCSDQMLLHDPRYGTFIRWHGQSDRNSLEFGGGDQHFWSTCMTSVAACILRCARRPGFRKCSRRLGGCFDDSVQGKFEKFLTIGEVWPLYVGRPVEQYAYAASTSRREDRAEGLPRGIIQAEWEARPNDQSVWNRHRTGLLIVFVKISILVSQALLDDILDMSSGQCELIGDVNGLGPYAMVDKLRSDICQVHQPAVLLSKSLWVDDGYVKHSCGERSHSAE